jgi:hypothetical protein
VTAATHLDLQVPDDLGELDQWVLWRYEQSSGRRTKVPYQVSGKLADSTDPGTWVPFEDALNTWHRNRRRYVGLGFVFAKGGGLAGVDLDDALDAHGDVKPWARGIVERFGDTYTEISPSGEGLKIWARGSLPANLGGVKVSDGAVEMYDHARYFAVTGLVFRGAPLQIEDHAGDLTKLYERLTAVWRGCSVPALGGQIPYGRQHNALVSLCGTLRRRGVCDEAIEACLQVVNQKQCERPGPPENIARIVRSSRRWAAR